MNKIIVIGLSLGLGLMSCEKQELFEEEMNIEVKGWSDDKVTINNKSLTSKSTQKDVTIQVVGEWDELETLEDGTVIYESLLVEDSTQGEGIDIIGSTVYHIDSVGFLVMDVNYQDGTQGDHIYTDSFEIIK